MRELEVTPSANGHRLDLFVAQALGLSRARVKALLESGAVRLDGRPARKGDRVQEGQRVQIQGPLLAPDAVAEPDAPLRVLWADQALVFLDKPSGVPSHPLHPGETGTVANALAARYPECREASEDPREAGLCHRLDGGTSGVLLAARSREVWKSVRHAFSAGQVEKRYLALVTGPIAEEGEIDLPLGPPSRGTGRVAPAARGAPGCREARSAFRVLARGGEHALCEVRIFTGLTHQIRAHFAAIGAPVVGDDLYGGRSEPGLPRFFLHAASLALDHPVTHHRLAVASALPPELSAVLERRGLAQREGAPTP